MGIAYRSPHPYRSPFTYSGGEPGGFVSVMSPERTTMRGLLQQIPSLLGETGQYRRLTSGPVADAQTYTTWSSTWIEFGESRHEFVQDGDRMVFKRMEICTAVFSDAVAVLHQGDEVMDPTGAIWKVGQPGHPIVLRGNDRSGCTDYQLVREMPTRVGPSRGRGGY